MLQNKLLNKEKQLSDPRDLEENQVMNVVSSGSVDEQRPCCRLTKTVSLVVIATMTAFYCVAELIIGHLTKSNALVADGFHMLNDLVAAFIGLVSVRLSKRSSSHRNTFGWARAEILGSLINSVFLLALCFTIILEAFERVFKPEPLENVEMMMYVSCCGLAMNMVSILLCLINKYQERSKPIENKGRPVSAKRTKRADNLNVHAIFLNALSGSFGSITIITGSLIVQYAPPYKDATAKWKMYIDPVLSLIIASFITITVSPLLKKSSLILLQSVPFKCDIHQIKEDILKINGVISLHDFYVWSFVTGKFIASVHLMVDCDRSHERDLLDEVEEVFHSHNISSTTIQFEYKPFLNHTIPEVETENDIIGLTDESAK